MTPEQRKVATALGRCTFLPGSADKRFAREMAACAELAGIGPITARQAAHLTALAWKYRDQLPPNSVPKEKPE